MPTKMHVRDFLGSPGHDLHKFHSRSSPVQLVGHSGNAIPSHVVHGTATSLAHSRQAMFRDLLKAQISDTTARVEKQAGVGVKRARRDHALSTRFAEELASIDSLTSEVVGLDKILKKHEKRIHEMSKSVESGSAHRN